MYKKLMLICLAFSLLFCVILSTKNIHAKKVLLKSGFTVVVDAGHGGVDSGVTGATTGVKEADLNLTVAGLIGKSFYAQGDTVVLTRQNSLGLYGVMSKGFKQRDLEKRVQITKNAQADIFISVHMNKFSDNTRRGAQVFYKKGCEKSKALAGFIQDQLNGLDESTRFFAPLEGDYYVLNFSPAAAIIVECGFLSNPDEEALLISPLYQQKLADAIFYGAILYKQGLLSA